jgi:hypothetical protein
MVLQNSEHVEHRGAADAPLGARLGGRPTVPVTRDAFFARGRVRWLRRCLDTMGERPAHVVAFGWDRGVTTSELFENLHIQSLTTVDVSGERGHQQQSADGKATYIHVADFRAAESADLAFTHGVLDHMSDQDRTAAAVLMYRSLKSGGLIAVWQRNPWSPGRFFASSPADVAQVPHPAPMNARAARRLLRGVGFDIVNTTSAFFFPRSFAWFHPIEPALAGIPLGAQYMVLARKP